MNLGYLLGFPIILDLRALIDHRSSEYPDFTITHMPLWQCFEGKCLFSDLVIGKYRPGSSCGGCIPQPRPRDNGLFSSYSHAICSIVARLPAEDDAGHPRVSDQLGDAALGEGVRRYLFPPYSWKRPMCQSKGRDRGATSKSQLYICLGLLFQAGGPDFRPCALCVLKL